MQSGKRPQVSFESTDVGWHSRFPREPNFRLPAEPSPSRPFFQFRGRIWLPIPERGIYRPVYWSSLACGNHWLPHAEPERWNCGPAKKGSPSCSVGCAYHRDTHNSREHNNLLELHTWRVLHIREEPHNWEHSYPEPRNWGHIRKVQRNSQAPHTLEQPHNSAERRKREAPHSPAGPRN